MCVFLAVGLLKHTASGGVGTAGCELEFLRQTSSAVAALSLG